MQKIKLRHRNKRVALLILCYITLLCGTACAMGQNLTINDSQDKRRLYKYTQEEIVSFLDSIGYPKHYASYVRRNSDGSSLIFFSKKAKEALVVSCSGTVQRIVLPGASAWLNDKLEIIAWSDNENTFFASGLQQNESISPYDTDPSGKYFLRRPRWISDKPMSEVTKIYSIDKPDLPIAQIHMKSPNSRLFLKGDKIILIGALPENVNILVAYTFKMMADTLVKVDEKRIIRPQAATSPFNVIDLSPWSDEVLVIDGRDFPFGRSKWYVYHTSNEQLKYIDIGPTFAYGFYLQCDPLHSVKKQKQLSR